MDVKAYLVAPDYFLHQLLQGLSVSVDCAGMQQPVGVFGCTVQASSCQCTLYLLGQQTNVCLGEVAILILKTQNEQGWKSFLQIMNCIRAVSYMSATAHRCFLIANTMT